MPESHFVTSKSSTQRKGLAQWVDAEEDFEPVAGTSEADSVRRVRSTHPPSAKHSWNTTSSQASSRPSISTTSRSRGSTLAADSMPCSPALRLQSCHDPSLPGGFPEWIQLGLAMLETASVFKSNGTPVEGVHIRVDDEGGLWLDRRCKLVRPHFIQSIETHWMLQSLVRNKVDIDFSFEYAVTVSEIRDQLALIDRDTH
eukprot:1373053-Rhodomonas_salina.2